MNDDFLIRFRKPPRREFAAALYQRINAPMNTQRNFRLRRFTFAAALGVALIAALLVSPAARAAFNGLIRQIGGITYLEPEQDPDQRPLREDEVTLVPEERLSLEQARTRVAFDIQLPTWTPEGYSMSPTVRVSYFPHETLGTNPFVYITWIKSTNGGGQIELAVSQPVNWVIDLDHLQEVQINGQPAGLTGGSWNYDTGAWDTTHNDLTLTWMHHDVMYLLRSSGTLVEDLIRMAESIP